SVALWLRSVGSWCLDVLDVSRINDDAVFVGVDHGPGNELDVVKSYRDIADPNVVLGGFARVRTQRFDAQGEFSNFMTIAHGTVDDDPGPAIIGEGFGNVATHQCGVEAAAPVDHEHLAVTRFICDGFDQPIVMQTFHGTDASVELAVLT